MKPRSFSAARPATPDVHGHLKALLTTDWKRYHRRLKDCRKDFSGEAVHESRIATRRLLATVELLGALLEDRAAGDARRALRRHLKTFAGLRDVQAQLQLSRAFPVEDREWESFRHYLTRRERRLIRKTRKAVRRLRTGHLERAVKELQKQLQVFAMTTPAADALVRVRRIVADTFAVVDERRRAITAGQPEAIHRTRVAFKRFRYMVEALAPLLLEATAARLKAMRAFQTRMGDIQDAGVLREQFSTFTQRARLPATRRGALDDKLRRRQQSFIRKFLGSAQRLAAFQALGVS